MIEIENVHKSFGPLKVLKGIDLTVNKSEVLSIIGGSGSGKSTLLTCINGLEPIDSGRILVDGTDVHAKDTDINELRRHIGIGEAVDEGVANAVEMSEYGDARFVLDASDQPFSAARHDDVDNPARAQHCADGCPIGRRDELDCVFG